MSRNDVAEITFGVTLTAIAGWVDAIGFLYIGHLFVSFMSGDTTQLAVSASQSKWAEVFRAAGIILTFVLAVTAGRLLDLSVRPWNRPAVLYAEALLLASAALTAFHGRIIPVALIVTAMGIQNAVQNVEGAKIGPTYITGVLVNMGHNLADALRPRARQGRWKWAPYLLLWMGLVSGAAGGALAYQAMQLHGLLIPVAVLIALGTVSGLAVLRKRSQP